MRCWRRPLFELYRFCGVLMLGSALVGCGLRTLPRPMPAPEEQPFVQSPQLVLQQGERLSLRWRAKARPSALQVRFWGKDLSCLSSCEPELLQESLLHDELQIGENEWTLKQPLPTLQTVYAELSAFGADKSPMPTIQVLWAHRPLFPEPGDLKATVLGVEEERLLPQGDVLLVLALKELVSESGVPERPLPSTLVRRVDVVRLSWPPVPEFEGTELDAQGVLWATRQNYRINLYQLNSEGELPHRPLNPKPLSSRYWILRLPRQPNAELPESHQADTHPEALPRSVSFYIDLLQNRNNTYEFAHVLVDRFGNESRPSLPTRVSVPVSPPSSWLRALNLFPSVP